MFWRYQGHKARCRPSSARQRQASSPHQGWPAGAQLRSRTGAPRQHDGSSAISARRLPEDGAEAERRPAHSTAARLTGRGGHRHCADCAMLCPKVGHISVMSGPKACQQETRFLRVTTCTAAAPNSTDHEPCRRRAAATQSDHLHAWRVLGVLMHFQVPGLPFCHDPGAVADCNMPTHRSGLIGKRVLIKQCMQGSC